jgi:hypothetical protein
MTMLLALLAVIAEPGSIPAPAAPAQSEPAARTVAIPFNPPLGEALRYRQTNEETRNGRPVSTSLELHVTFTRDSVGYVMTTGYLLPQGMSATHPAIAVLMRPLSLRVSDQGEIVGMVDEAGYWAALDTIVDGLARNAGGDAAGAESLRGFIASMRTMPEEARLALIARNLSPLIEYSATEMRLNEVLEGSIEGLGPLGPVVQDVRTTLTEASASEAVVQATYRLAPGQLEAMVRDLRARFGRAPNPRDASLAAMNVERRDTYRISLRTGLTEVHEAVTTASGEIGGEAGGAAKRQRLERIR